MHCLFQKRDWSVRDTFPSQAILGQWCGLSRTWVCICLKEMQQKGLLMVVKREGTSNLYVLAEWIQPEWLDFLGMATEKVRQIREWWRGEGVKSLKNYSKQILLPFTKDPPWHLTPLVQSPSTAEFVHPREVWRQMAEACS